MKVMVYWNLHKGCWSVKALEGPDKGRVIGRYPYVLLRDVIGKVSQAGRRRVLAEDRKNVHAGIVGTLLYALDAPIEFAADLDARVTYNPRKYTQFVYAADESPFDGADLAYFAENRAVLV